MKRMPNIVIFDIETTGLYVHDSAITQIAMKICDPTNAMKPLDKYMTYIKRYKDNTFYIKPKSKDGMLHSRVTLRDVDTGQEHKKIVKDLMAFFKSAKCGRHVSTNPILCGHNVSFDIKFMVEFFEMAKQELHRYVSSNGTVIDAVDTKDLGLLMWPKVPFGENPKGYHTLTGCADKLNEKFIGAHDAMNDVEMTRRILKHFQNALMGNVIEVSRAFKADKRVRDDDSFNF